jgi:hypothetical protein
MFELAPNRGLGVQSFDICAGCKVLTTLLVQRSLDDRVGERAEIAQTPRCEKFESNMRVISDEKQVHCIYIGN